VSQGEHVCDHAVHSNALTLGEPEGCCGFGEASVAGYGRVGDDVGWCDASDEPAWRGHGQGVPDMFDDDGGVCGPFSVDDAVDDRFADR
jgi:hypothetical protein